jgi:class 3 adenylate cyclase/ABC-type branched-subunit amino acid transport system substrate-binding protein
MRTLACVAVALWLTVATALPVRKLCTLPGGELTPSSLHAKHATVYYAATFPAVTWEYQMLGDGNLTAKNFVRSWAIKQASADSCDVLLGPGFSYLAIAMSPVVEVPWIDFSATSVAFSDKSRHATFSRMMPTDEVGSAIAVAAMLSLGWYDINVLCVDDPFGRSAATGATNAMFAAGGTVHVSRCVTESASVAQVREVLTTIANSKSRIVFAAMLPSHIAAQRIIAAIKEMGMEKRFVFFWCEAMCSLTDRSYATVHGSLCSSYTGTRAVLDPFLRSYYHLRNQSEDLAQLRQVGAATPAAFLNTTDVYAMMAHDAAFHAMSAINHHTVAGSAAALIPYLRQHVSNAASGRIVLDSNGDRLSADSAVYNAVAPDGEEIFVGRVASGVFSFTESPPRLYLLDNSSATIPGALFQVVAPAEDDSLIGWIIGGVIAALITGGVVVRLLSPKGRDNSAAPKEAGSPFAIVFTDIQSSTALWGRAPEAMSDAVELHHNVVRRCIAAHGGYEVKTIGDSFMVAFGQVDRAVDFAVALQLALHGAGWVNGGDLNDVYDDILTTRAAGASTSTAEDPVPAGRINDVSIWRGLRVRIGVHYGTGNITKDAVTGGYDYYGTVVNTAARVESVGHGGQVLVTGAVVDAVGNIADPCNFIGDHMLNGLDRAVAIHQVTPRDLNRRTFPALRLNYLAADDSSAESDELVTPGAGGSHPASSGFNSRASSPVSRRGSAHGRAHAPAPVAKKAPQYRLNDALAIVKAFLSPCKAPYRVKTLIHLNNKWRGPAIDEKRMVTDTTMTPLQNSAAAVYYDDVMRRLVLRTLQTLTALEKRSPVTVVARPMQPRDRSRSPSHSVCTEDLVVVGPAVLQMAAVLPGGEPLTIEAIDDDSAE